VRALCCAAGALEEGAGDASVGGASFGEEHEATPASKPIATRKEKRTGPTMIGCIGLARARQEARARRCIESLWEGRSKSAGHEEGLNQQVYRSFEFKVTLLT
jgi:hypothetical protein